MEISEFEEFWNFRILESLVFQNFRIFGISKFQNFRTVEISKFQKFLNIEIWKIPDLRNSKIKSPEIRIGRALENAYKFCPSGNVTRQNPLLLEMSKQYENIITASSFTTERTEVAWWTQSASASSDIQSGNE